jgi:hypothetical protein
MCTMNVNGRSRWAEHLRTWWDRPESHRERRIVALLGLVLAGSGVAATVAAQYFGNEVAPTAQQPAPTAPSSPGSSDTSCSSNSEKPTGVGWGPDRPLYLDDTYPATLTFNSTYQNSNVGDERNFVTIKPASDTNDGGWLDLVEVEPDTIYLVRAYVRLDGPANQAAANTVLKFNLPTCTGHRIGIGGILSASNTFPGTIWDGAEFWSRTDFNLALIPDSAVAYTNAGEFPLATNGLPTATGVPLGTGAMDGNFKPGYAAAAYVVFQVRAQVAAS